MSDRTAQARAEADRRVRDLENRNIYGPANSVGYLVGHAEGVEWADANRTITRGEYAAAKLRHDNWRLTNDHDLAFLAGLHNLGIEVADDEAYRVHSGGS